MNRTTNSTIDPFSANLTIAAQVFVLYCIGVHLAYLVLLALVKDLRRKSLFFINHSVVANLLFPIGSVVFQYFDASKANSTNHAAVTILCSFFEIYWPFSIYTRMYSILLIALHRYLAVFNSNLFKRINKSNVFLFLPVASIWLLSLSLSFIFKYSFSTTYSTTFCLHGFSTIFINSLLNAIFYILFSMIFPAIAIVTLYIVIFMRLKQVGRKVSQPNSRVSIASDGTNSKSEMRFANQFILMCLVVVLTVCGISIFSLRGVIPNYFNIFYYWRPVIRCYIMFFSSLVPIFSFYFNPFRKRIFSCYFMKRKSSGSTSNVI